MPGKDVEPALAEILDGEGSSLHSQKRLLAMVDNDLVDLEESEETDDTTDVEEEYLEEEEEEDEDEEDEDEEEEEEEEEYDVPLVNEDEDEEFDIPATQPDPEIVPPTPVKKTAKKKLNVTFQKSNLKPTTSAHRIVTAYKKKKMPQTKRSAPQKRKRSDLEEAEKNANSQLAPAASGPPPPPPRKKSKKQNQKAVSVLVDDRKKSPRKGGQKKATKAIVKKKPSAQQKKSAEKEIDEVKSTDEQEAKKVKVIDCSTDNAAVPYRDFTSYRGHGCTSTIVYIGMNIVIQMAPVLYVNKETGLPQSWDGISIIRIVPKKPEEEEKKQKSPRIDMPLHCIQPLARALRTLDDGMQEIKKTPPTVQQLHEEIQKQTESGGDGQAVIDLNDFVEEKKLPHSQNQIHQFIRLVTHTKQFQHGSGEMISFVKDLNGFKDESEKNTKRKFTISFSAKLFDNLKLAVYAMAYKSQEKTVI